MPDTIRRFLIAGTQRDAELSAAIDYNWKRVGPIDYMDHEGERVRILRPDAHALYGLRPDVLYVGPGGETLRSSANVLASMQSRGTRIMLHWETFEAAKAHHHA